MEKRFDEKKYDAREPNPTVAYLRRAWRADAQYESLIERADRYREKATRATSSLTALRNGGTARRSPLEDAVVALVDLSDGLSREAQHLADTVREIERAIATVPDEKERRVLCYRYLNDWKWQQIADALSCDVRHVTRLHGQALLKVRRDG